MRDYIDSFKRILPDSQRQRIIDELANYDPTKTIVSADEYVDYVKQITDNREVASSFTPMDEDRLSSSTYNKFLENASIDLNILYNENNILETAIDNYVNATQSTVSEVNHYLDELRKKVERLRYDDRTTSSTSTFIENFKSVDNIQKRTTKNANDYLDRDGKALSDCLVNVGIGDATLHLITGVDVIIDDKPKISLVQRTGTPTNENLFPITNAIDRNYKTFWGNILIANDKINIPIETRQDNDASVVYKNGAICIFDITFNQKRKINEMSFQFFEEFPTIVEKILYKVNGTTQEHFISLTKASKTSSGHITKFSFPLTDVKMLRVILRQPNFRSHEYTVFKKDEHNNKIIQDLIEADVNKSLRGDFSELTDEEEDKITGVATFKKNYAAFLVKFKAFKALLKAKGFNWSDEKIKEYIKTGRY